MKTYLILPVIYLISLHAQALQTGFETAAAGPFTELTSETGVWSATDGHVRIDSAHADLGQRCLHITGGENHCVELKLKKPSTGRLVFNAERWTGRAPFEFRISVLTNNRWQEIYNGDKTVALGGFQTKISVDLPEKTGKIRFACTAPEGGGILIDNVRILEPSPMRVLSAGCEQKVTPVLVNNESDPVLKIKIVTEGNLKPLSIKKMKIELSGIELTDKISIRHEEADREYAVVSQNRPEVIFNGSIELEDGENTLSVGVKLRNNADIDKSLDAACEAILISDGKVIKPENASPTGRKRLGIALRKGGDDNCVRYRIPGLDTTPKGTLIAVYDCRWTGGSDLPGNIDIGMSRSTDGGRSWEPMKVIMDMGNDPKWHFDGIGDPCVLVDRNTGTIWVGATWSHGNRSWHGSGPGMSPEETGQYILVKSEDDGHTWSKPVNITEQIKQPGWCFVLASPGRGITMTNGTLVMPSQFQDTLANRRMPYSTVIYSTDHGENWKIGTGAKSNTTECRIAELCDGSLMLNMRDNRGGSRSVCTTTDMGTTWKEHPTSRKAMPEPVCNACLISLKAKDTVIKKNMLIFCNPDSTHGRNHMTLKVSLDDGMTWPEKYHMLLDADNLSGGYPSTTLIDKETLGVLYEGSRAQMTFQRIKLRDLLHLQ